MDEWIGAIKFFGTAIGSVVVWLAGLKIWEMIAPKMLERRYARQDQQKQLHDTNEVANIDLDKFAFKTFYDEFRELKKEVGDIREKLSSQMEKNARLDVENKHLKETNERQQAEIGELRNDRTILQGQVNSLTNLVTRLQTELEDLKKAKAAEK
jgi:regulator of replication initiation timing